MPNPMGLLPSLGAIHRLTRFVATLVIHEYCDSPQFLATLWMKLVEEREEISRD